MKVGDLVRWAGASHRNLQGIVVGTRCRLAHDPEAKVIWNEHGLGSLKPTPGGAWQSERSLRVVSSVEQDSENR